MNEEEPIIILFAGALPFDADTDVCRTCGEPVSKNDDAISLLLLLTANPSFIIEQAQHLLPNAGCPGYPDLAQYLEGQPRTSDYNPAIRDKVRFAHEMLKLHVTLEGNLL